MKAPRTHRWLALAAVNLAALAVPFGVGWADSMASGEQLHPPRTGVVAYDAAAALADATEILAINGRALFWMLALGVMGGGSYGLLLLAVNGNAIGRVMAALHQGSPVEFWYMLSYAPFEFAALAAANCAAQMITWTGVDWLRGKPATEGSRAMQVVAGALLVLVVAAALEAHAMQSDRGTWP